jgi:hypothetical protein
LLDLGIGLKVGERVGWPPEKVAAVKMQRDGVMGIQLRLTPPADEMLSCRSIDAIRIYLSRLRRAGGELGAARLAIEESGKTPLELIEESKVTTGRLSREYQPRDAAEKAAQAAASAASSGT